jgi:hypothetical protein
MRKLALTLDSLVVESFEKGKDKFKNGTVRGNEGTTPQPSCENSCLDACGTGMGMGCESTGFQVICDCTAGGYMNGTCDNTCESCPGECATNGTCYTQCSVGCA